MNSNRKENIEDLLEKAKHYWLDKLDTGIKGVHLPGDRGKKSGYKKQSLSIEFESELTEKLFKLSKNQDLSLFAILLAVFKILLYKYTRNSDILVATPEFTKNKKAKTHESVLLWDLLDSKMTFLEVLMKVTKTVTEGYKHQYLPLTHLLKELGKRDIRPFLGNIMLMENIHDMEYMEHLMDLEINEIILLVKKEGNQIQGTIIYNGNLFSKENIKSMKDYYKHLLHQAMMQIKIPVQNMGGLQGEKRDLLLEKIHHTEQRESEVRGHTLHQKFEEQAKKTPENIVLTSNGVPLTYKTLNEKSNQLARYLKQQGLERKGIVGLLLKDPISIALGTIAVLKAGGAYLPINPEYPENRIQHLIGDSHLTHLIQEKGEMGTGNLSDIRIVPFNDALIWEQDKGSLENINQLSDIAYIIYTSGTSGKPKGVMVKHHSVLNYIGWRLENYGYTQTDVSLQPLSYSFDGYVSNFYSSLLSGGRLVCVPSDRQVDYEYIKNQIREEQVTNISLVPGMYTALMEYATSRDFQSLRFIVLAGEKASQQVIQKSKQLNSLIRLINEYGPTETTVTAVANLELQEQNTHVIGQGIRQVYVYIMDENNQLQPEGVPGEICVSGRGMSLGYLNNPELTEEKFNDNPFLPGEILYRTGDMGRWKGEKEPHIEFLGRLDHQLKIRGYRIEPGEIESQLLATPGIEQAVIVVKEVGTDHRYLCAYVKVNSHYNLETTKDMMAKVLPDYMIPRIIIPLEEFPLTINGKVDRTALQDKKVQAGEMVIPPRNEIEKKLVEVWAEVLGMEKEKISIDSSFFEIGGDSIKSIQISARIQRYRLKVEVSDILEHPRIVELSNYVQPLDHEIDQGAVEGDIALTPIQKWFFTSINTGHHHFNQSVMLSRKEGFEVELLTQVFLKLMHHHDLLRTLYKAENGHTKQYNQGESDVVIDFQQVDIGNSENLANVIRDKSNAFQESMDLSEGPLFKQVLYRTPAGDHLLLIAHHLVVDGISWRILLEDFRVGYQQLLSGQDIDLPGKTDSFQYWTERLKEYSQSRELLKEIPYWKQFEKKKMAPLSTDFELEPVQKRLKSQKEIRVSFDKEHTSKLITNSNKPYHTEINDLLLTALAITICEWQETEHCLINLEGHGREKIGEKVNIGRTVGWFTTQYPVLLEVVDPLDIPRSIISVKESLRKIPGKGIGYGVLKYLHTSDKGVELELKQAPEISFNYLGSFDGGTTENPIYSISSMPKGRSTSPEMEDLFKISLNGMISDEKLYFSVGYQPGEYQEETVQELMGSFKHNLMKIINHCYYQEEILKTPSDFGYPELTIEELEKIQQYIKGFEEPGLKIEDIYPLSPMQDGMLFHTLMNSKSTMYLQHSSYQLEGYLEPQIIEQTMKELSERHAIFRTIFIHKDTQRPLQVVLKNKEIKFRYEDIRDKKEDEREKWVEEFKKRDRNQQFVLESDVLVRLSLLQKTDNTFELLWTFHHILMDGWCISLINSEFFTLYNSNLEGKSHHLPETKPFKHYIDWLQSRDTQEAEGYWKTYLQGFTKATGIMKSTDIGANESDHQVIRKIYHLDKDITQNLRKCAANNQVTLYTLVQAIWGVILAKMNHHQDVVFGAVVADRPSEVEGIEEMVGLFINTIPVRINIDNNQSFKHIIQDIHRSARKGEAYTYYPLTRIQAENPLKGDIFDHILAFENYPEKKEPHKLNENYNDNQKLELKFTSVETFERSNYDLNVRIVPLDSMIIDFLYNPATYNLSTIEEVRNQFMEISQQVAEDEYILFEDIQITLKGREVTEKYENTEYENYDF
jgi:iturin family lipopeptide synthetase C